SGRRYVPVKGADGVASFVPEDEIVTPGALTPQSLMEARKGLSHFWNQATGPDERGVGALISGLDNHIRDQAASGAFSGSRTVADDMSNAIGAFRGYKQAFANTSNSTHGAVAAAMKSLI